MSKLREAAQAVMATESLPAMVLAMARLRDALVEDGKLLEAAVLAEREACAKVCDSWSKRHDDVGGYCAAEIRARGKNEN